MNLKLTYIYRDGANYKLYANAIFSNPEDMSLVEAEKEFRQAARKWELFPDMVHFKPELVGLPTCYFTDVGCASDSDDFELHEFSEFEEVVDTATDPRSIVQFLKHVVETPVSSPEPY